jgi:DNA topoisomerase II
LKEFFEYRVEMYEMRKEYMLAKLKLDYEILANKVQFIQAVIAGTIKINGKKRSLIMQQCKTSGLKTWTQLQDIMTKFIKNEGTKSRIEKRSP